MSRLEAGGPEDDTRDTIPPGTRHRHETDPGYTLGSPETRLPKDLP
jgi:hypothetical protein